MYPPMLVNCSGCKTPLRLPPAAKCIRCVLCEAVTHIADASQSYSPAPPPAHGKKKALIVAVSYRNTRRELKGCINDAKCMRYLLVNKFKFPEDSILMLTEEENDPLRIPTKHNMQLGLFWLVQGCQPGDSLVFHYSGHGSQRRCYTGDEIDGFDEMLLPLDFRTQGTLIDDEINAMIVRPLPQGVRLHAIIDACHSGTVLDLPFLCRLKRSGQYVWEDHRPRSGVWKGTSGGEVICFSGCDDGQTSADTSALSRITSTGAMTYCFIQAIEKGAGTTYESLLSAMRNTLHEINTSTSNNVLSSFVTMLLTGGTYTSGLNQEPQLTSTEPFDVYAKLFYL